MDSSSDRDDPDRDRSAADYGALDRVYDTLKREILDGARPQGAWLREGDVARSLGVSRTPVREAVRRLAAEGLVRHEPNRGVRVANWTSADVDEIFGIRAVLEPWGSALAAARGEADLERLRALADEMDAAAAQQPPDFVRLTALNNDFHGAVLQAAGNARLADMLRTVVEVPLVRRTFEHYQPPVLRRSLAHHHELVEALAAGDAAWAESVMRAHIHSAWISLTGPETGEERDPRVSEDDTALSE